MTKRYPLGGALGSRNAGDPGNLKGIALGIFQAANGTQDAGRHADEGVSDGGAGGDGFGGNVDHTDFAARGVVREFWHFVLGADCLSRKSGPTQSGRTPN
jgi:hypothetical protein